MAMACFGFVTFAPLLLRSLPSFIAFISRSTLLPAAKLYFRVELFFAAFLLAMALPPTAWKQPNARQLHQKLR